MTQESQKYSRFFLVLKYNFDISGLLLPRVNKVFQYTITLFMLLHIFSEKVVE